VSEDEGGVIGIDRLTTWSSEAGELICGDILEQSLGVAEAEVERIGDDVSE
jgi:hypothetical protein